MIHGLRDAYVKAYDSSSLEKYMVDEKEVMRLLMIIDPGSAMVQSSVAASRPITRVACTGSRFCL